MKANSRSAVTSFASNESLSSRCCESNGGDPACRSKPTPESPRLGRYWFATCLLIAAFFLASQFCLLFGHDKHN